MERSLVELGFVTERALMMELARRLGVPFVEIGTRYIGREIVHLVPERFIRSRKVFPIGLGTESRFGPVIVATNEPDNLAVLDEVAFATAKTVEPMLASERDIDEAIVRYLGAAPLQREQIGTTRAVRTPGSLRDPRRAI